MLGEEKIPEALTDKELQTVKAPSDNAYTSYAQYFDTMFPLLVAETWQSVVHDWKEKTFCSWEQIAAIPCSFVKINSCSKDIESLACRVFIGQNPLTQSTSRIHPEINDLVELSLTGSGELKRTVYGIVHRVNRSPIMEDLTPREKKLMTSVRERHQGVCDCNEVIMFIKSGSSRAINPLSGINYKVCFICLLLKSAG